MAEQTHISWTDSTFNPWIGCTKVATGCTNCYAKDEFADRRHRATWGPTGTRSRTSETYWKQPLRWNREVQKTGMTWRVLCGSLCDVFEDWNRPILNAHGKELWNNSDYPRQLTIIDCRSDLFDLIDQTPCLTWLLLTKRPQNIQRTMWESPGSALNSIKSTGAADPSRKNVMLGTSISTQADTDENVPELLKCRDLCNGLFVSAEPLLADIELYKYLEHIDQVIVGGESGPHARPMFLDWARSLRNQTKAAGKAFFFKQVGGTDKNKGGCLLDGREWKEFPTQ